MVRASVILGVLLAAAPAFAHHSFYGTYDVNQPVTIQGVVARVLLRNPHAYIELDAVGEDGKTVTWTLVTASGGVLIRRGFRESVKVGDHVTVSAYRSKRVSNTASAGRFKLADGREIVTADTWGYPGIVVVPRYRQ
jgi:hypothetical protein